MKSRLKIGHLLAIFFLGLLPLAATFLLPYPDERHYTDGAMQMLRNHDWLVPQTPQDGTAAWLPRFHKPPLAYWAVAASFAAGGTNVLMARLPFLLAGCATLLLTWQLARKLTGNATTAHMAALVLLSHPQFAFAATRSIPDALLTFFVVLSAYGFLRLIAFQEFTSGAYWMAYGGAAGAALSKGLLGVGIVLFAWAFFQLRERKRGALLRLIHFPSLGLGLLLVVAWFAYIFHRYGAGAWHTFFDDQVSGNMHGAWWAPIARVPVYALVLVVNFLPWSLPTAEMGLRRLRGKSPRQLPDPPANPAWQSARRFILAWAGILIVGFSLGSNISLRYLLPATPLMAIVVADWIVTAAELKLIFSLRRISWFLAGLLGVLVLGATGLNLQWPFDFTALLMGGLLLAVVVLLVWGAGKAAWFTPAESAGLLLLLTFPILFFALNKVVLPDPCEQMAAAVKRAPLNPAQPVLFVGKPAMASGIRLFLGKDRQLVRTEHLDSKNVTGFAALLVPEADAAALLGSRYDFQPAAIIAGPPPQQDWWTILRERRLPAELQRYGTQYVLALP